GAHAVAVPTGEPGLETLGEGPQITPWHGSGKLDCTTFTEGVSIARRPRPMSRSPGTKATTLDEAWTRPSKSPIPISVITKPATISVLCEYLFASRCAAKDETRTQTVA